jgi:hypothetical protein
MKLILTYFFLPRSKYYNNLQDLLIRGLIKLVRKHPWPSRILIASLATINEGRVQMSPHKLSPICATPSQNQDMLPSRFLL